MKIPLPSEFNLLNNLSKFIKRWRNMSSGLFECFVFSDSGFHVRVSTTSCMTKLYFWREHTGAGSNTPSHNRLLKISFLYGFYDFVFFCTTNLKSQPVFTFNRGYYISTNTAMAGFETGSLFFWQTSSGSHINYVSKDISIFIKIQRVTCTQRKYGRRQELCLQTVPGQGLFTWQHNTVRDKASSSAHTCPVCSQSSAACETTLWMMMWPTYWLFTTVQ